jgi:mono/diheme cytochrome c family protein
LRRHPNSSSALAVGLVLLLLAGPAAAAEDAAARGAYLAAAAGCGRCHTDAKHGGKPFAGGRPIASLWGTVVTPNITPDRATGIGGWQFADFARAMRWGAAPDDSHYLPAFPFLFYNRLTEEDLRDLKAYLDTLPAVSRNNEAPGPGGLSAIRAAASLAIAAENFPGAWRPNPAKDPVWNRGAYLAATIGRCEDCHTPRNPWGARDESRAFAGMAAGPDGKKVPNITSDPHSGIGKWSIDDIATLLETGEKPDFDFTGGPMGEIVDDTAHLSDADRHAIAVYIHSLPPVSDAPTR